MSSLQDSLAEQEPVSLGPVAQFFVKAHIAIAFFLAPPLFFYFCYVLIRLFLHRP